MEKVSVNKNVLIAVVAIAGISLLALVFVLGRESGSGSVSAPPTRIERVAPRAKEEPVSPPTPAPAFVAVETRPASGPAPPVPEQRAVLPTAASEAPPPTAGERGSAGPDAERAAVAAYFDAIDRIQAGAVNGEPESVANGMAAALANGDTSGLDKMLRDTEAAKASLAAVTPPAPCVTHHRETLASLDDALEVLRSMKTAMESSDPAAQLARVSARATELRSRADALQKEEQALRQRYGLKH